MTVQDEDVHLQRCLECNLHQVLKRDKWTKYFRDTETLHRDGFAKQKQYGLGVFFFLPPPDSFNPGGKHLLQSFWLLKSGDE